MAGRRRIARGRPDLERGWCARKPFDHHSGEQVRLPGGRAHPEDRGQPRLTESSVQVELAPRHVEEATEVDVVGAGCERAFHHLQVQPVVRAVDADRRAGERPFERRRVARVHVLVPLEPEVARRRRRLPRFQEFEHLAADRPGCSDDGDHGCRIFSILVGSICGSRAAHRKRPSRRSTGTLRRARPLDAAPLRRAQRARGSWTWTGASTSTSPAGSPARTSATGFRPRSPPSTSRSTATCTNARWSGCTNRTSSSAAGSPS